MSLSTEKPTDQQTKKVSGFQEDLEHLRQSPLFRGLDYECLKLLAILSRRITLITDDQLMVQGEDDGHGFKILSGKVNAICRKGETNRVICQFGPGQFIGGCALLGKQPRLFTLQATEETVILRLSREEFQKTVQRFPQTISQVAGNLVSELVSWDRNLLEACDIDNEAGFQTLGVSLL